MEEIPRIGRRDKSVKIETHKTDCQDYCPICKYGPMNGVTAVEVSDEAGHHTRGKILPKDGDISICANCGEILQFYSNKLVLCPQSVLDEIEPDQMKLINSMQEIAMRKKRR